MQKVTWLNRNRVQFVARTVILNDETRFTLPSCKELLKLKLPISFRELHQQVLDNRDSQGRNNAPFATVTPQSGGSGTRAGHATTREQLTKKTSTKAKRSLFTDPPPVYPSKFIPHLVEDTKAKYIAKVFDAPKYSDNKTVHTTRDFWDEIKFCIKPIPDSQKLQTLRFLLGWNLKDACYCVAPNELGLIVQVVYSFICDNHILPSYKWIKTVRYWPRHLGLAECRRYFPWMF